MTAYIRICKNTVVSILLKKGVSKNNIDKVLSTFKQPAKDRYYMEEVLKYKLRR